MYAKITAYNTSAASSSGGLCSNFSINHYWKSGYKNVFYLCSDTARPVFEDIIETTTDSTGQTKRILNTSIEKYSLAVLAASPLLSFLKTIDKHEVKTLEILSTGDTYNIKNIDIEDEGAALDVVQRVNITFELDPITNIKDTIYEDATQKIAHFDNNGDGTPDINGEAQYTPTARWFTTDQLYYEADGITPATAGAVRLLVYAERDGEQALIGRFSGNFGDSFTDATKWNTLQNLYDYFDVSNTVGHTNEIKFFKRAWAEDYGYLSTESEDRAVKIRFDLNIDAGAFNSTTLELVYTVNGAFSTTGVLNGAAKTYGITTVNNLDLKTTIGATADARVIGATSNSALITSFQQIAQTVSTVKYLIDIEPSGEISHTNNSTTGAGYVASSYRASDNTGATSTNALNYTFGVWELALTKDRQRTNVLNFTSGLSPYQILIPFKFDKFGSYTVNGNVANNTAELLLNGATAATFYLATDAAQITSTTTQATGAVAVTLPDTNINTLRLKVQIGGAPNLEIFTQFQAQLYPLF